MDLMSSKSKGINAERELVHRFWSKGWTAVRIAGSGSSRYPSPDILAGNNARKLAIECKSTKRESKYLTKKEVLELKSFSQIFGAEPWIGVKFEKEWFFISAHEIRETDKGFGVIESEARAKGLLFDELLS